MPEPSQTPSPAGVVTADDLIRGGLCRDGVRARLEAVWRKVAAAMTLEDVLRLALKDDRERILRASGADGYGDGCGESYDLVGEYGAGYGFGYGHGYDYGDGGGFGEGYGYDYGDGFGYGHGEGCGYGYDYGDGEGCGDGYAYGDVFDYGDGYGCGDIFDCGDGESHA